MKMKLMIGNHFFGWVMFYGSIFLFEFLGSVQNTLDKTPFIIASLLILFIHLFDGFYLKFKPIPLHDNIINSLCGLTASLTIFFLDKKIDGCVSTLIYVLGSFYFVGRFGFKGCLVMGFVYTFSYGIILSLSNKGLQLDDYVTLFYTITFPFTGGLIYDLSIKARKGLKESRKRIQNLVENLEQGFMVFNEEGLIQSGSTDFSKKLFKTEVDGKFIQDILRLNEKEKDHFNKWIDNVYRGIIPFKDLRSLAPKSFKSDGGRYIELDYKPIYKEDNKKRIDRVICIAADKTNEIALEKRLELDREEAQFITTCLENPIEFSDLLEETYDLLDAYPTIRDMDEGEIFRKFHTLKARFGQFGLKTLTQFINEVETAISEGDLTKVDSKVDQFDKELLEFVKKNRLIIEAANKFLVEEGNAIEVSKMIEKIIELKNHEELIKYLKVNYLLSDIKSKFERYKSLIDELSKRQDKSVHVEIGGDEIKVDTSKYSNFISSSIHLFRNMIDHGIETEEERRDKGKSQRGNIKCNFKKDGGFFFIIMSDDGGGINPQNIREKLLKKGLKKEKDLELNDSEIIDFIFLPGFSTKEEVTEVSGRGVGMDAVREEVERLGGVIFVSSKIGEGTTFTIKLPIIS